MIEGPRGAWPLGWANGVPIHLWTNYTYAYIFHRYCYSMEVEKILVKFRHADGLTDIILIQLDVKVGIIRTTYSRTATLPHSGSKIYLCNKMRIGIKILSYLIKFLQTRPGAVVSTCARRKRLSCQWFTINVRSNQPCVVWDREVCFLLFALSSVDIGAASSEMQRSTGSRSYRR
jgi:hypothetical protein